MCETAVANSLRRRVKIISSRRTQISSTRVQHKVGSRDEMRWRPYIIGPWVARVPADHAWRTITRADEMKRTGWDESGEMVEWNLRYGENGRNPVKNLPRPHVAHHETHMEGPSRELGTPAVGGERLTACATRPPRPQHAEYFHSLATLFNILCFNK